MEEFQLPEMLRTPLEELVLQIKILKLGQAFSFLQRAIEPPKEDAVRNAIECLKDLVRTTITFLKGQPHINFFFFSEGADGRRGADPFGSPLGQLASEPSYRKDYTIWCHVFLLGPHPHYCQCLGLQRAICHPIGVYWS